MDRFVACGLGTPVSVDGMNVIGFEVGAVLGTVEHVIGGVMHEGGIQFAGFLSHDLGCLAIDRHGTVGFLFRLVDRRVCGGV